MRSGEAQAIDCPSTHSLVSGSRVCGSLVWFLEVDLRGAMSAEVLYLLISEKEWISSPLVTHTPQEEVGRHRLLSHSIHSSGAEKGEWLDARNDEER